MTKYRRVPLFIKDMSPFGFGNRLRLEAEVLQRLGRPPVQPGRLAILATPRGEIALGNPGRGPVADRGDLLEADIGSAHHFFSLVQAILLEQRTSKDQLSGSDLVQ